MSAQLQQPFEEIEFFEGLLINRHKLDEQSASTKRRFDEYAREKRAWLKKRNASYDEQTAEILSNADPKINMLHHSRIDPASFPDGCRIRELHRQVESLRESFAILETEFSEARTLHQAAKRIMDNFDHEAATSPLQLTTAITTEDFYGRKLRSISPRYFAARSNVQAIESDLKYSYAAYSHLVDALNVFGEPSRPLAEGERVEDRAREVGETARLTYLIFALMQPVIAA
jgi:hypothetical protein